MSPDVVPDPFSGTADGRDQGNRYLQAQLDQIRANPLKYGHGLNAQQEKWAISTARRRLVVAGNRIGKTESGMREVLWRARGDHPYRKVKPHSVIWVGSPDYPSYLRYHKPAFDQWCPPDWIVGEFHQSEKWVKIRREDGGICTIFFLSYDMPRSKWQGAGVDFIWLDEECPEEIVNECLARIVTTQGDILLTFTPVSGAGWWYDRLWEPAQRGEGSWVTFQAALATKDPNNEAEYEVGRPLVTHLSRDQIVEFASEYPDPDERAIRIFGEVRGRKGLVYKQFKKEIHVVPAFTIPEHYELWGAVDPGYHGFAAGIVAIDPKKRIYVVEEFFSQQETTKERFLALTEKVRGIRGEDYKPERDEVVVFFVDTEDPQVVLELNTVAAQVAEEVAKEEGRFAVRLAFASLDQGLKARKAGFLRVQQTLQPRPDRQKPELVQRPTPDEGEPGIYFFDTLHSEWQAEDRYHRESRTLWELQRYSWKKPTRAGQVQSDDADENSAGGAHAMAWLRYLLMARLGPPEEPEVDQPSDLPPYVQEIYEHFEEVEHQQLEGAGLL